MLKTKELIVSDPHKMYQYDYELIEALGEAEEIFLKSVVETKEVQRYFIAIDDCNNDEIPLDIADYIGESAYNLFDNAVSKLDKGYTLTYDKASSMYLACIKESRKNKWK